jgi:hypothetical protein
MRRNEMLDRLYALLRVGLRKLQPYRQRPLTAEENARRTSIIRDDILPIRNQIIEIESGLNCSG